MKRLHSGSTGRPKPSSWMRPHFTTLIALFIVSSIGMVMFTSSHLDLNSSAVPRHAFAMHIADNVNGASHRSLGAADLDGGANETSRARQSWQERAGYTRSRSAQQVGHLSVPDSRGPGRRSRWGICLSQNRIR
jgi:hypothetical protein